MQIIIIKLAPRLAVKVAAAAAASETNEPRGKKRAPASLIETRRLLCMH